MNKEETIKLEYTKELYNRTIKREKELEKEADKIFEEIKIDIHNLITEKLVLRNIKEGLFEEIKKQARQEGKLEGIAEEKKRSIQVVDVSKELSEVRQRGIRDVVKIILKIKDKSREAVKLADSREERLAYDEWISCCNEILDNIKECEKSK